jgi:hypothetical protein
MRRIQQKPLQPALNNANQGGNNPQTGANQGDGLSGVQIAMHAQADGLHPVKKGSLGAKTKPSPRMMQ